MSAAKIGKPGNRKGVPCSEKTKQKLREIFTGRFHTKATKEKLRKIAINMYQERPELRKVVSRSGVKHHNWKNGRSKKQNGYILILKPNHPFANSNRYVMEHRLVMEQHIGRLLKPEEVVHHINGDITDNRIDNLQLLPSKSAHRKLHLATSRNIL